MSYHETVTKKPTALEGKQGFSVVEVLISVAIQAIVMLVLVGVFTQVGRMQSDLAEQKKAQETAMNLAYQLRSVIGQAVDLNWSPGAASLNTCCAAGTSGRIREYDSYAFPPAPDPSTVDTLAVFWREWAPSTNAAVSSMQRTAIYFQRPTADASGVVYVDLGQQPTLEPDANDLRFDGVVGIQVSTPPNPSLAISTVTIRFTTRSYRSDEGDWKWCPPAFTGNAACTTSAVYVDTESSIEVPLRNNILGPARFLASGFERVFDQLHFFRTVTPVRQP